MPVTVNDDKMQIEPETPRSPPNTEVKVQAINSFIADSPIDEQDNYIDIS